MQHIKKTWILLALAGSIGTLCLGNIVPTCVDLIKTVITEFSFDTRGIDLCLPLIASQTDDHSDPFFSLTYKALWGYRGAGSAEKPFTGIQAQLGFPITLDGLTIDICKARSVKKRIARYARSLLKLSPLHEFYLKFCITLIKHAHTQTPHLAHAQEELSTLFARLKKTPHASDASLPIVGHFLERNQTPGLVTYFEQSPRIVTEHIIGGMQRMLATLGLTHHTESLSALVTRLIASIDYFGSHDLSINLSDKVTLTLPAIGAGSGERDLPFIGGDMCITLTPGTEDPDLPTEWIFQLSAEHMCIVKLVMLFVQSYKSKLSKEMLIKEVGTLFARFALTPPTPGSSQALRNILGLASLLQEQVMDHDFRYIPKRLTLLQLCVHLLAIAFKAYSLRQQPEKYSKQDCVDFVTEQTAYALRASTLYKRFCRRAVKQTGLQKLEKDHAVKIDTKRFITLLLNGPGA